MNEDTTGKTQHKTQRCDNTQLPKYLWKISYGHKYSQITKLFMRDNYMGYSSYVDVL